MRPEPKAQLADRLSVVRALTLLSYGGAGDVQTRLAAQLLRGIVQPGARPFEPAMPDGESFVERVAQCHLQVADWLSERGGNHRVPAVDLDRSLEVPATLVDTCSTFGAEQMFRGPTTRAAGEG